MLKIELWGVPPVGQPRPRATAVNGKVKVYQASGPATEYRANLAAEAIKSGVKLGDGPIYLYASFFMARPKSHFRKDGSLVKGAPVTPGKPDLDNVVKVVMDALTFAGVWTDDSKVVGLSIYKHYTDTPLHTGTVLEAKKVEW